MLSSIGLFADLTHINKVNDQEINFSHNKTDTFLFKNAR